MALCTGAFGFVFGLDEEASGLGFVSVFGCNFGFASGSGFGSGSGCFLFLEPLGALGAAGGFVGSLLRLVSCLRLSKAPCVGRKNSKHKPFIQRG